jgi:hypothetical protein
MSGDRPAFSELVMEVWNRGKLRFCPMEQEACSEELKLAKIIYDALRRYDDEQHEYRAMISGDPLDPEYQSTLIDGFIDLIDLSSHLLRALKEESTS